MLNVRLAFARWLCDGATYRDVGSEFGATTVRGQIARGKAMVANGAKALASVDGHPLQNDARAYTPTEYVWTDLDTAHVEAAKERRKRKKIVLEVCRQMWPDEHFS